MVTITYGNRTLHCQSMSLITNINEYFVYLSANTIERLPVFEKVNVNINGKSQEQIVLESIFEDTSYRSKLVDTRQYAIISKVFPCINFTGNTSDMLKKLGVKCLSKNTSSVHWIEPSQTFESLVRALDENTQVPNGGAPRWMLDTTGAFVLTDLVEAYSKVPKALNGRVNSDILDLTWMHSYPGNLVVFYSSVNSIERLEIKLDKRFSWGRAILNDCTTEMLENFITKYKSEFYGKLFTTRKIIVSNLHSIAYHVGDCVMVNAKVKGVITAINLDVRINAEHNSHSITVACPE